MGRSRASKDQLALGGTVPRSKHAEGENVDKWMQDVHPKKGALHEQLHIPEDKKIPTKTLEKATHAKSRLLKKRANLALNYRGA